MNENNETEIKKFLNKMKKHFCREGLIIYGLSQEYFKESSITFEDANALYDLLVNEERPEVEELKDCRNNLICCCLYTISLDPKSTQSSTEIFYNYLIKKLNQNTNKNKADLYLAYNLVEFEDKFHKCNREDYENLLAYLQKFCGVRKTLEEFLLFKLYLGILSLYIGDYKRAFQETFEIVSYIHEEIPKEQEKISPFIKYITLRNNLFNARVGKQSPDYDINEYCSLLDSLYGQMKKENEKIAIKIGLNLIEAYKKRCRYDLCEKYYNEVNTLFKDSINNAGYENIGTGIENGMELSLALSGYKVFVYTFKLDTQKINSGIRKIAKRVSMIEKEPKYKDLKTAYDFILLLYQSNSKKNNYSIERSNEIIKNFKETISVNNSLFSNTLDIKIDIYALNSMDNFAADALNFVKSSSGNSFDLPLGQEETLSFFFGTYNLISSLTLSLLNDPNASKQKEYKEKIKASLKTILDYIEKHGHLLPSLKTPYLGSGIITLYYLRTAIYFRFGEFQLAKDTLKKFENGKWYQSFKKDVGKNISDGYIWKIKGDIAIKEKKYEDAIKFYSNSNETMKGIRRGVNQFNIGYCYCMLNNSKKGLESFNLSLNTLTETRNQKNLSGMSRVNMDNIITQKIRQVEEIITKLTS